MDIKHPLLDKHHEKIAQSLLKIAYITKKTSLLGWGGDIFLYEYANIIFLIEVRAFHAVLKVLDRFEKQLQQIFHAIGFMDAMISIASYRAALKNFVEPEFINTGPGLKVEEVVHPLIKKPVPNSIDIESQGILITGSNMAGKTTFLKAIGINVVLAQTINTCIAKKYQSCFFNIITLIGRADNVIEGKSYYLDEIQGLLRIIDSIDRDITCQCLLDEIFQGTNSLERVSASGEVLLYLARHNCVVFATTHEHELIAAVGEEYSNYHFSEEIKETEGISFNYKLLGGPSTSHNAIKLLRYIGYPAEITSGADKKMKKKMT